MPYVTEKFFLSYKYNMVPVTFGLADYSLYGPPGSYINALDFDSVEELGKYLLYLDKNDDEYLKYFSWKEDYKVVSLSMNIEMCIVCQTINDYFTKNRRTLTGNISSAKEEIQGQKKYPSFRRWYETLPSGQTNALYRIGKNITLSTTKTCIDPQKFPGLKRWILGEPYV